MSIPTYHGNAVLIVLAKCIVSRRVLPLLCPCHGEMVLYSFTNRSDTQVATIIESRPNSTFILQKNPSNGKCNKYSDHLFCLTVPSNHLHWVLAVTDQTTFQKFALQKISRRQPWKDHILSKYAAMLSQRFHCQNQHIIRVYLVIITIRLY